MGEDVNCPKCGRQVDKRDAFCKHCGADLSYVNRAPNTGLSSAEPQVETAPTLQTYERKFTTLQRFYKLVVSPKEAMQDIAAAPDYGGVIVLLILEILIVSITLWVALQKFQFVGPQNIVSMAWSLISGLSALVVFISALLYFVFWIIKSVLVKSLCNTGSEWSFTKAAAVTGYAYVADVVFAAIGTIMAWLILPTVVIDISSEAAATQAFAQYQALLGQRLMYAIPISLIGLLWKSYLGGIGTYFGTNKRCPLLTAIFVFFILGFIGFLISQISRIGA